MIFNTAVTSIILIVRSVLRTRSQTDRREMVVTFHVLLMYVYMYV